MFTVMDYQCQASFVALGVDFYIFTGLRNKEQPVAK